MEEINIICNQCGTALQIAEYDTYATCPNCTTHLKIIEDKHTISTIIIEQRGKNRKPPKLVKTEHDTTLADLNKELEELDSAWQTSVLLFNRKQKQTRTAKFEWEAISTILVLVIFFNLKLSWFFIIVVIFIGGGVLSVIIAWATALKNTFAHKQAKNQYLKDRKALIEAIHLL